MASGALPPALPMVKIGTDHFWDGGIVSNTPLQHLLDQDDQLNSLVFQVDLFSARGALAARYPGRAGAAQGHHVLVAHPPQHRRLPAACTIWKSRLLQGARKRFRRTSLSEHERSMRDDLADLPEITILQLIYQQKAYEGHAKDYEFSGTSMREHWQSGHEDTTPHAEAPGLAGDAAGRARASWSTTCTASATTEIAPRGGARRSVALRHVHFGRNRPAADIPGCAPAPAEPPGRA